MATFAIDGLTCQNCVAKATAALAPFADRVSVTLDPPRVTLTEPHTTDKTALNAALAKAGSYRLTGRVDPASPASSAAKLALDPATGWLATYWPLLVITGYIAIVSLAGTGAPKTIDWGAWMTNFMAGFFLVFSAFKFLDLSGFADAYATYDLLAKRWHGYGLIYPFLELALGLAYLFRVEPFATHIATIALMGFSSLGVIQALSKQQTIQCACLGTALKLPMSTITLVEDLGMVAMAAIGLVALSLA